MHVFSKALRKTICQGFQHDGVIVIVLALKFSDFSFKIHTRGYCKAADVVSNAR